MNLPDFSESVNINGSVVANAYIGDGSGLSSVQAASVANDAISTSMLQDGAVTAVKLDQMGAYPDQVLKWNGSQWEPSEDNDMTYVAGSGLVMDGEVLSLGLFIGDTNILPGTMNGSQLMDGAISTAKLADGSVTNAKLADGAVGASKIEDDAVTSAKMADGTIVNADVSSSAAIAFSKLDISAEDIQGLEPYMFGRAEYTDGLGNVTGYGGTLVFDNGQVYAGPDIVDSNYEGSVLIQGALVSQTVVNSPYYISTISSGTAPLTVSSTTKVSNLNVDMLDGLDNTAFIQVANDLSDLSNVSTARTNLGLAIGTDVQAYDAGLTSISGLTTAADKMIYATGSDTYATTDITSAARSLLDDATVADMRATLGVSVAPTWTNYTPTISVTPSSTTARYIDDGSTIRVYIVFVFTGNDANYISVSLPENPAQDNLVPMMMQSLITSEVIPTHAFVSSGISNMNIYRTDGNSFSSSDNYVMVINLWYE